MLNEITKKLVGTVCILPCGDSSLILDTVQNFVTLNQDSWSLLIKRRSIGLAIEIIRKTSVKS